MKPSARITAELLISIPQHFPGSRVARSNTGGGVGMGSVRAAVAAMNRGDIAGAKEALQRPLKFGSPGQGDISGWLQFYVCRGCAAIGVVPKCCGGVTPISIVLEVEVKVDDEQSEQQGRRQEALLKAGGCYVLAHSCEEGIAGIEKWIGELNG